MTLADRFENSKVEGFFVTRIIGHKIETMNCSVYSGSINFDRAVETMAKVEYKRES